MLCKCDAALAKTLRYADRFFFFSCVGTLKNADSSLIVLFFLLLRKHCEDALVELSLFAVLSLLHTQTYKEKKKLASTLQM